MLWRIVSQLYITLFNGHIDILEAISFPLINKLLALFRFQIVYHRYYTIKHMLRRDPADCKLMNKGHSVSCVPGMCSATSMSHYCFFLQDKKSNFCLSVWVAVL